MTSEIFPQSQAENPIDRIVDPQQRLDARQAEVHALVEEHNKANGFQSSFASESQAISDRRREAHQAIADREQLVDPNLAQAASIGGMKRFFSRFKRTQRTASDSAEVVIVAEESHHTDAPVANLTSVFAELQRAPKSEEYELLSSFLTAESLAAKRQSVTETMTASPEMVAYGEVYEATINNSKSWSEANRAGDQGMIGQLNSESEALSKAAATFDQDTKNTYATLREQINQIDKYDTITLSADDPKVESLLSLIAKTDLIELPDAPFKHFTENDQESWKVVSDEAITDYLEAIPFISSVSTEEGTVIITPSDGQSFDIPISLMKHAQGFDSWKGRHDASKSWNSEFGSGSMSSLNVIKHYAGLSTELPPVSEIRVIVQPDGKVFCDNGSGDSHRISAAFLRGDSTIKAEKVEFVRLSYNAI